MRFAAAFGHPPDRCEVAVRRMLAAQALPGAETVVHQTTRGAIGVVTRPGAVGERTRFVRDVPGGGVLLIAGTPISVRRPLDATLRAAADAAPNEAHALLADLDGAYVALHWHPLSDTLGLVTDFLGLAPAFEAVDGGWRLLASTERAILAAGIVSESPDPAGWGAFLGIGQPLPGQTKTAAIGRLDGALSRSMDGAGRVCAERTTWRWPTPVDGAATSLEDVVDVIGESVGAYQRAYAPATQLFSGGYDSRVIGNLVAEAGGRPHALVQSYPDQRGDADGVFGVLAARRLGFSHQRYDAPRDFFSSADYQRYVELGDLALPSIGLFICTTPRLLPADGSAVWMDTLVGPALMRTPERGRAGEVAPALMRSERARRRLAALRIFTPAYRAAMIDGIDAGLAAVVAGAPDGEAAERMLFVTLRTRLRIGSHFYRVHDAVTPAATPGATRDSWDAAVRLPIIGRAALARYEALHRTRFARTADIPILSGGALRAVTPRAWPRYLQSRLITAAQTLGRRPKLQALLRGIGAPMPFAWDDPPDLRDPFGDSPLFPPDVFDRAVIAAMREGRIEPTVEERRAATYWRWQHGLGAPVTTGDPAANPCSL